MNRLPSISLAATILLTPGVGSCKLKQKIFGLKGYGDEPFRYENCAPVEATLPKSTKYITTIFNHITAANPEVFRGDLDPAKFCLSVKEDQGINAVSSVKLRRIEFNTGILLAFKSDEGAAGVMAHELAHIVRRHSSIASEVYPPGSRKREESINILLTEDSFDKQEQELFGIAYNQTSNFTEFNTESDRVMNLIEPVEKKEEYRALLARAVDSATRVKEQHLQYWENYLSKSGERYIFGSDYPPAPLAVIPDWLVEESSIAADIERNIADMKVYRAQAFAVVEGAGLNNELSGLKSLVDLIEVELDKNRRIAFDETQKTKSRLRGLKQLSSISDEDYWNGTERDADDIGQQYFLKAGFSRYGFEEVFAVLDRSESPTDLFKKCVLDSGYSPTRGIVSHPTICWRLMYATGWGSSRQNALEISRLGRDNPRSPVTVAFEDGYTLLDAQAEIRAHFEPASPLSPQPPSLPYPPNRPPSQPNPPFPGYRN